MPARPNAEVLLIPESLRMAWTDYMALDASLPHCPFRIGCVIGSHINRQSGETFLSQETIARVMGVSLRTVWAGTSILEDRGYFIIKRREFAPYKGKRVAGGRGVANIYVPSIERSQISATFNGQKLAERCDLIWKQRSQ